jgi:hypothetical protein
VKPDQLRKVQKTYNQRNSNVIVKQLPDMECDAKNFVDEDTGNLDELVERAAQQLADLPGEDNYQEPTDQAIIDDGVTAASVHAPDLLEGEDSDLEVFGPSDSGSNSEDDIELDDFSDSDSEQQSMQGAIEVPTPPRHKWRPEINVGNKQCTLCKKKKKSTPATQGLAENKVGGTVADVQYCVRCAEDSVDADCEGDRNELIVYVSDCYWSDCYLLQITLGLTGPRGRRKVGPLIPERKRPAKT